MEKLQNVPPVQEKPRIVPDRNLNTELPRISPEQAQAAHDEAVRRAAEAVREREAAIATYKEGLAAVENELVGMGVGSRSPKDRTEELEISRAKERADAFHVNIKLAEEQLKQAKERQKNFIQ